MLRKDIMDSIFLEYYHDGNLKMKIHFDMGLKHGTSITYESDICYHEFYKGEMYSEICYTKESQDEVLSKIIMPVMVMEKELSKQDKFLEFQYKLYVDVPGDTENRYALRSFALFYKNGIEVAEEPKIIFFDSNTIEKSYELEEVYDSIFLVGAISKIYSDSLEFYVPTGIKIIPK